MSLNDREYYSARIATEERLAQATRSQSAKSAHRRLAAEYRRALLPAESVQIALAAR